MRGTLRKKCEALSGLPPVVTEHSRMTHYPTLSETEIRTARPAHGYFRRSLRKLRAVQRLRSRSPRAELLPTLRTLHTVKVNAPELCQA